MVAVAYTVFGLTGFGSTVLALPALALVLPLKFAVALLMLLDLAAALLFGRDFGRHLERRELGLLVLPMLAGIALGLTLFIRLAEGWLLLILGAFLLAYAGWGLLRRGPPPALPASAAIPAGLAGGAFAALFGTGGVLFALYNAGRIQDKAALRANNAATILFTSVLRTALFAAAGLLAQESLLVTAAILLPALLAGVWLGHRLHAAVPAAAVVKAVYAVLVMAGLLLLLRST